MWRPLATRFARCTAISVECRDTARGADKLVASWRTPRQSRRLATVARATESPTLLDQYNERIAKRELRRDEGNQLELIKSLEALRRRVEDYDEGPNLYGPRKRTPKGMYIYGGVGTGKTMSMNMFFSALGPWVRKRRVHFHDFMRELHVRMHEKRTHSTTKNEKGIGGFEAIQEIGREIADDSVLLALDEFFISDAADAALVSQTLAAAFRHGLVLVTTSNTAPGELFPNDADFTRRFVEGILRTHCKFVNMSGTVDYREVDTLSSSSGVSKTTTKGKSGTCKFVRLTNDSLVSNKIPEEARLRNVIRRLEGETREPLTSHPFALDFARTVRIPWVWRRGHDGKLCMGCTFDWLCGRGSAEATIGVNDYAAFCKGFDAIYLLDVNQPLLPPEKVGSRASDATRKFCYLLDVVYDLPEEKGVEIVCVSRLRSVFAEEEEERSEPDADEPEVIPVEGEDDVVGRRSYKRAKSRFRELFREVVL